MLVGPVLYLLLLVRRPDWFGEPARWGDPVEVVLRDVLLTGAYPALTWGGPLLVGVWVGRQDLWSAAVRTRLTLGRTVVAALAWATSRALDAGYAASSRDSPWWQLMLDDSHSEMPLWLIGSTASAVAVLGLCLHLADRFRRGTDPLVALGRLALTAYVVHLLLVALVPGLVVQPDVHLAAVSVLGFSLAMAVAALLWLGRWPHGPLESLLRAPARWVLARRLPPSAREGTSSGGIPDPNERTRR